MEEVGNKRLTCDNEVKLLGGRNSDLGSVSIDGKPGVEGNQVLGQRRE